MAAAVQALDEIIKEYLLFRGFTNTLKAFEGEVKLDKDKSFRVNKIVEQLISFVQYYDLQGIREYWSYLKRRFFSRLDSVHLYNAHKLEKCLYRFYLVNAVQTQRPDKVTDFFEKMAPELQNQADWKEWFVLPFLKSPDQNPSLDMYFSSLWQETFPLSLHNFLNAIFQSMPLPRLLKFDAERIISEKLKQDNNHLHKKIVILQQEISILQEIKERKIEKTTDAKDIDPQPRTKATNKETKPKDKEATFIQRRFRRNKDSLEKRKSQLLEQDEMTTATAQSEKPSKTVTEKTSNMEKETQDFGTALLNTKSDSTSSSDSTQSSERESGNLKSTYEKIQDSQNTRTSFSQDDDENLLIQMNGFESRKELREKRSQSLSSKKNQGQYSLIRRTNSNVLLNNDREMKDMSDYLKTTTVRENLSKSFLVLGEETFSEHRSPVMQCDFSPSGKMVSSVDLDGIVKVWKHQPTLSTVATVMLKSSILCTEWASSKSDKVLLLGTSNGKIRLYDTETKTTRCDLSTDSHHSRVVSLACSPLGTSFVCSATVENKTSGLFKTALSTEQSKNAETACQGTLLLWDLKTLKLEWVVHLWFLGNVLLANMRILENVSVLLQFGSPDYCTAKRHLPLGSNMTRINCIAYNHNGTLLVTGGADGFIRIYDTRSYDCLMSWSAHAGQVNSVQFNVDETSVFSLGRDNQIDKCILKRAELVIAPTQPPKFLQWSLRQMGFKTASFVAHDGMCGPRDLTAMTSSRSRAVLFSRLFTFDCKGEHLLTCAPSSGIIYKYNKSDKVLSQVFSIGESRSHVTSVDWNTAGDCITCLTGCIDGPIRMTTLLNH